MKTVLVTGGAGFIGGNFLLYFINTYKNYTVINLDKLTYAANESFIASLKKEDRYTFIKGDICDRDLLVDLFNKYKVENVIHFAAESHVDNSINGPGIFIETNIVGTHNLLNASYRFWMDGPGLIKKGFESSRFHHISTDEVYGSLGPDGYFTEQSPYAPNSPYSASKASSDMLVRSYHKTYGMNTVITNCSNNYGPGQNREKLIPTVIRKALNGEQIPIYGNGKNIRDWLYVEDHARAIDVVFHRGRSGEVYNIGGDNELENIAIAGKICAILDEIRPRSDGKKYDEQIAYVSDRPGHDWRYAIDPEKISKELDWKPEESFESGLRKTIDWYLENGNRV